MLSNAEKQRGMHAAEGQHEHQADIDLESNFLDVYAYG
jgi:hypothetical protein